jgi:membrane protein YqaA with SNARE-associated domain
MDQAQTDIPQTRPGPIRRLYDWVLRWAESRYAPYALFALAFAEACFFPVPPDLLLVAMCLALPRRGVRYALICTAGSVLGGMACYGIGMFGMQAVGYPLLEVYGRTELFNELSAAFGQHGFGYVFIAALTPIPYCVFTLAAGASYPNVTIVQLVAASILGRGLRFGIQGVLFRLYGPRIKGFLDRYFNLLTIVGTVLLVLLAICVKMFTGHGEAPANQPAGNAPETAVSAKE